MTLAPRLSGLIIDEAPFAPLMGLPIGTGSSRVVLAYKDHPDLVIKVGYRHAQSGNWTEWNLWHQIENNRTLAPLFGECVAMSASGKFLVMEKLDNLTDEQAAARLCPLWVTDKKPSAFGINQAGKIKLRDYGQLALGLALASFPGQPVPK